MGNFLVTKNEGGETYLSQTGLLVDKGERKSGYLA